MLQRSWPPYDHGMGTHTRPGGSSPAYVTPCPDQTLPHDQWQEQAATHAARVDTATAARRDRIAHGETHPVDDFMYDYYSVRPTLLRRWHPGAGVALEGAASHASWRWYAHNQHGLAWVDTAGFLAAREDTVRFVLSLMRATASRTPRFGCFGMHEWAMVYRTDPSERRHHLPLRLSAAETNDVVDDNDLGCTHIDAFRFFTPEARPRNAYALTRANQSAYEQPGCLHANMDLYKWCTKLLPAIPSALQQDAFEFAVRVRRVDMQASPYDVSSLELEPIRVETSAGKAEYAEHQRVFAAEASSLRMRLIDACEAVLASPPTP